MRHVQYWRTRDPPPQLQPGAFPERRPAMVSSFATMLIIAVILCVVLSILSLRIATQYERAVVFRLGRYNRTAGPGIYFLLPMIEWQVTQDLRTKTTSVDAQETITRDNVPIKIEAVIWQRIVDPRRAVIEVAKVDNAVVQVALTTLRSIIGQHTLDDVLKEQDTIAHEIETNTDKATEPWGVKVERVQMKNVEIPESMQRAMAQEAEALREKRARAIKAEAELDAATMLRQAAETIMQSPAGLELRRMQMITEVGAEQNTMTIVMMPSEFVSMARSIGDVFRSGTAQTASAPRQS
jgi:regulator of protease activity HflC (stomatin/prohibitin superfamily)